MNTFLVIVIVVLAALTLIALVRGLAAFLMQSKADLEGEGVGQSQLMQNKMMFARIKFQALAILAVAVLLLLNR